MEEALRKALLRVRERLRGLGIDWAIFAGAASYLYGARREITDIDIMVREENMPTVSEALGAEATWLEGPSGSVLGGSVDDIDLIGGMRIVVGEEAYEFFMDDEMARKVRTMALEGIEVPVLSPEDNVVFKGIMQRGEGEGKRDVQDVAEILNNQPIDPEYLMRRAGLCGAEERVLDLLMRLGWRPESTMSDDWAT